MSTELPHRESAVSPGPRHAGKCPKFCSPGCKGHAKGCPRRIGGLAFARPKGKRKRTISLPAQMIPALKAQRAAQKAERAAAGDTWEEWDLVWCQPNGHPIDTHDDWDEWKALLAEARIKDVRLHDARHTAGTLLGELHVDMHVIQQILGHAQITTTRRQRTRRTRCSARRPTRSGGCSGPRS